MHGTRLLATLTAPRHPFVACAVLAAPLLASKLGLLLGIGYYSWAQWAGDALAILALCGLLVAVARWRLLWRLSWPLGLLVYGLALLIQLAEVFSYYFQAGSFNDRYFANVRLGNLRSALDAFGGPFIAALAVLGVMLALAGWLLAQQSRLGGRDARLRVTSRLGGCVLLVLLTVGVPSAWQRMTLALAHGRGEALADSAAGQAVARQLHAEGPDRSGLHAQPGKNLVIIYMESLERIYTDASVFPGLTPNLNHWRAQGLDFQGFETYTGAGYTMAGIFASQCGAPFFTSPTQALALSSNDVNETSFQAGLACLGDVLHVAGYTQVFMNGSPLTFADQGAFFRVHGFDQVLGLDELQKAHGDDLPAPGWGLYDRDLLRFAAAKYAKLADAGQPFQLDVLTIDNHPPHGRPSPGCPVYQKGEVTTLQSVHCTDSLVGKFLDTISKNPAWRNTVVVLMSDHQSMRNDAWPLYPKAYPRRPLLFVVNAGQGVRGARFYHMDIAPTALHLLGVKSNAAFIAGADRSEPGAPGNPLQDSPTDVAVLRKAVWDRARPLELCTDGRLIGSMPGGFEVGGRAIPLSQFGERIAGLASGDALMLMIGRANVVAVVAKAGSAVLSPDKQGLRNALLVRPLNGDDPQRQFALTWIGAQGARADLGDVASLHGLQIQSPHCGSLLQQVDAAPADARLEWQGRFALATAPLYPPLPRKQAFDDPDVRRFQRGLGWLGAERWGSWTVGDTASMGFTLPDTVCRAANVEFKVHPYVSTSRPTLDVSVYANGKPAAEWHFDQRDGERSVRVQAPVQSRGAACHVDLRFDFHRPGAKPPPWPETDDPRPLQLGFVGMTLQPPQG